MTTQLVIFQGANGDNILSIIRGGSMKPDFNHEIYYSEAAFGFKARITLTMDSELRLS